MKIYKLAHDIDTHKALKELHIDSGASTILHDKMHHHLIKIEGLHVAAANILKQDALSIGAEVATPKGVITCEEKYVDVILMGTTKHLKSLSKKELSQPFGLKTLALELKSFIKKQEVSVDIMGVINANDDSFFSASRFQSTKAVAKIYEMIKDGASIIDIGAVSSRPGSTAVDAQEELSRLRPIIDMIWEEKIFEKATFSIDSYEPLVVAYALEHGFKIINDITGLANNAICELAAQHKARVVIMHMQGNPQTMQENPQYENVVTEVSDFFKKRIEKAQSYGITDICLDVGIGFGKSLEHNLLLLKHLGHFESLGFPLLIGASRKSMIDHILPTPVEERLPATLAIHMEALKRGASIIRCHDVKEHTQALSIHKALQTILY